MQKDQVDHNLNFKKRARRRLVGAIALVLLMVVILPWMLEDREKKFQEDDVEILMPPQSDELEASLALENTTDDHIEKLVIDDVVESESTEIETVDLPKIETPTQGTESEKAVTPVEAKKDSVSQVSQNKNTDKADKYYVQIGVFSDPSNIKKLQLKLDDLGYKSLTEKITTDTGIKTRLRTENFIGRNEAAIALQNIKDAGLAGMVVSQK